MDTGRRVNRRDTGRRERSRVEGHFEADLVMAGRTIPVRTENVSLKGMLVAFLDCHNGPDTGACPEGVEDGEGLLRLPLAKGMTVEVEVEMVRARQGRAALRYMGMDEDSYTHLRNIVRLAANDADDIDREQVVPAFDDIIDDADFQTDDFGPDEDDSER